MFFLTFYVFGACFRMLAVIPVSKILIFLILCCRIWTFNTNTDNLMTSVCFVNHRKEKGSEYKSCPWVVFLPCYLKQGLLPYVSKYPLAWLVCTVLFNCQMPIMDGSNVCPLAICFRSLAYKSAEAEIILFLLQFNSTWHDEPSEPASVF